MGGPPAWGLQPSSPRLGGPTQGTEWPPPTAAVPFLQVKELGAVIYNCSRLARDLEKTFQTYWVLGAPKAVLPKHWPRHFSSHFNRFQPLWARFAGVPTTAYFSVRGLEQCPRPPGRPDPAAPGPALQTPQHCWVLRDIAQGASAVGGL